MILKEGYLVFTDIIGSKKELNSSAAILDVGKSDLTHRAHGPDPASQCCLDWFMILIFLNRQESLSRFLNCVGPFCPPWIWIYSLVL